MLAPVCRTVGSCWVVFWDGSLLLMGIGIGVSIGCAADSPIAQVSGFLLAADATHMRHWVRLDRFADKQICYIQSM